VVLLHLLFVYLDGLEVAGEPCMCYGLLPMDMQNPEIVPVFLQCDSLGP
jgi:hypothetical protein